MIKTDKKTLFSAQERIIHSLRGMYGMHGYLPFKMSKFEKYDFYMKNRDFLLGENIISFTDADGSLLALKPDVTLSIIKNAKDSAGVKEKLYYSENVYRTSASSHKFKEIMQMGLECIGDIDSVDVCETLSLAADSLELIDENFVLDISHMGFVASLLDAAGLSGEERTKLIFLISGKNLHEASALLEKCGTSSDITEKILALTSLRVPLSEAPKALSPLVVGKAAEQALDEIAELVSNISSFGRADKMFFDASLMNDMNYYNGVVFRGFIAGISEGVLSGGRYDALMQRMGKSSGAVGFAIYLDLLEGYSDGAGDYDVDVLLLYDEKCDTGAVLSRVNELVGEGLSVSAQKAVPEGIRFRRTERIGG
ncbi:MAG: ATP phosphoribosyltransferase regulatory subunit [Clostridia bacterium]|nr:ATP phosphoribosyltransferase regulatory subunit [Clostridia bacterium]